MKATTLKSLIEEELKDEEFKFYYEQELEINEIAQLVHHMRIVSGLTQAELARKASTTQPVIARLEGGTDSRIPSLDLLCRIAHATNKRLSIKFEDTEKGKSRQISSPGSNSHKNKGRKKATKKEPSKAAAPSSFHRSPSPSRF